MDIESLRKEIDAADKELASAFIRRMTAAAEIGRIKKESSLAVTDRKRELEIIGKVTSDAPEELVPYIEELYENIFRLSREMQKGERN